MAAYRYFRFTAVTTTSYFNPTELTLYEESGAFTPFAGAVATASSVYGGGDTYKADNAFDGSTSTSYHSGLGSSHWLKLDLGAGQSKTLRWVKLRSRTDTHLPVTMLIEGSADDSSWTTLGWLVFETWTSASWTIVRALSQTGALEIRGARHIRDMVYGGNGQFSNPANDPITLDNAPYQARLRVFDERTGHLVREAWSAADGTWTIPYLNRARTYLVVAYDAAYPPLAHGGQTPDPMS